MSPASTPAGIFTVTLSDPSPLNGSKIPFKMKRAATRTTATMAKSSAWRPGERRRPSAGCGVAVAAPGLIVPLGASSASVTFRGGVGGFVGGFVAGFATFGGLGGGCGVDWSAAVTGCATGCALRGGPAPIGGACAGKSFRGGDVAGSPFPPARLRSRSRRAASRSSSLRLCSSLIAIPMLVPKAGHPIIQQDRGGARIFTLTALAAGSDRGREALIEEFDRNLRSKR